MENVPDDGRAVEKQAMAVNDQGVHIEHEIDAAVARVASGSKDLGTTINKEFQETNRSTSKEANMNFFAKNEEVVGSKFSGRREQAVIHGSSDWAPTESNKHKPISWLEDKNTEIDGPNTMEVENQREAGNGPKEIENQFNKGSSERKATRILIAS